MLFFAVNPRTTLKVPSKQQGQSHQKLVVFQNGITHLQLCDGLSVTCNELSLSHTPPDSGWLATSNFLKAQPGVHSRAAPRVPARRIEVTCSLCLHSTVRLHVCEQQEQPFAMKLTGKPAACHVRTLPAFPASWGSLIGIFESLRPWSRA
jgi:hypothetical protein